MRVIDDLAGKRILIWGNGREGQSTKSFLDRLCKPALVDIYEGKREGIQEDNYDLIFKSPGIVMEEDHEKYTSQTEVFLTAFRDQIVGITGTKGKSTTSSLLYHVLRSLGKNAILVGNIGEPCLNYFEEVTKDTIIVYEMSCHQLAHAKVSPHVAIFLNLFEEHLDYYKTFDKYFLAKSHIAAYQQPEDYYFCGDNVPPVSGKGRKVCITKEETGQYELSLLGEHNQCDAEFVFRVCTQIYGLPEEAVKAAMKDFTALPHRLQLVGSKDGVDYYDDSISTIPTAAISALGAVQNAHAILLGGMDRGIDYSQLITYMKEHDEYLYICSYDSGRRIYDGVCQDGEKENVVYIPALEEAVNYAREHTPEGGAVLLSPASPSYGFFKNFEERGDYFRLYAGFAPLANLEKK